MTSPPVPRLFTFVGGSSGTWQVEQTRPVVGESLPAIARRLHHCRDLGPDEPFDFLTWFEYAPADAGAFEDLVGTLRDSPEWRYVDREVDIRLAR
jgi:hypothetical protein